MSDVLRYNPILDTRNRFVYDGENPLKATFELPGQNVETPGQTAADFIGDLAVAATTAGTVEDGDPKNIEARTPADPRNDSELRADEARAEIDALIAPHGADQPQKLDDHTALGHGEQRPDSWHLPA